MKIIFLDVDGVLNSTDSAQAAFEREGRSFRYSEHMSTVLVARLNDLLDKTDAQVVISSTWRLCYELHEIFDILEKNGFKHDERIFGVTPHPPEARGIRGLEIQAWMEQHGTKPNQIVILDDSNDMAHLMDRLVLVNPDVGLTDEDVAKALKLLGD